ncbi:Valyl-tRNA synthetase [Aphelenchoides fujianensis]|nr:Valyl-tRNA synthetase [Aphelenchoides fujianensis]
MLAVCRSCRRPRFVPPVQSLRWKVSGTFNFEVVSRHYAERYASRPPELDGAPMSGRRFSLVLPPPNVTGVLHSGHALTVAIEDALVRFHRLKGDEVRWTPGFDHAGIATQQVVEKRLLREQKKRLEDVPPAEFLALCHRWKDERIRDISAQLRQLTASLDWDDLFYTMDERFVRAVRTAFVALHRSGKIFRSDGQWFLDCTEANAAIRRGLDEGSFHIDPECTKAKLLEWLNNNEPWCLSRQMLWGHRIPLYRRTDDEERWVAAESVEEAARLLDAPPAAVLQCPDVLDTWFSSALIPLVVGGDWPRNARPTAPLLDLLQTGHDIIGFWIARMWTVCHALTGEFPFTRVSLHGMIRDAQHRKMSKSLGNVVDPLHVINGVSLKEMLAVLRNSNLPVEEIDSAVKATRAAYPHGIKRYGTDALRFAFYKRDLSSLDVSLNLIEGANEGHKFCNKLWNAVKYVHIVAEKRAEVCGEGGSVDRLEEAERRVLERLDACVDAFKRHMAAAHPHLAFGAVFDFLLRDFCDVYLEATKKDVWSGNADRLPTIAVVLSLAASVGLRAMGVFMPLVCNFLLDECPHLAKGAPFPFDRPSSLLAVNEQGAGESAQKSAKGGN